MSTTQQRAQLERDYPVLTEVVNGKTVTLDSDARSRVLDEWEAALIASDAEAAAAAARKVWPNAGAFVADFAPQEIVAIARSGDGTLTYLDYVLKTWQGPVHSDDPRVQAAFARLLALGILTKARVAQLLAK